ncbi:stellacyanin-like isoform X2 [Andrographis paniculata]|uniref:stellacyanin-like isoform X2 n=1 Tax=Andrographis paniculata TaxID=175694 RepID=UPI0021E7B75C|nr:stellacyanin-like isoform X2 [Andrographis paniculata]
MALSTLATLAAAVVVVAAELVGDTKATTYVVGDTFGGHWKVPSGSAENYTSWASEHGFQVGDVLGNHTVAHVTKASYDTCNITNPIELITEGPANVTLDSIGENHYICTRGRHCSFGQKISINITTSLSTPTPTSTPSPSSTGTINKIRFVMLIISCVLYDIMIV